MSVKNRKKSNSIQVLRPNAAGIDIGCHSHFVAVPPIAADQNVKEFSSFTDDLHKIAAWLKECGIDTVRNLMRGRLRLNHFVADLPFKKKTTRTKTALPSKSSISYL